ncbi:Glycosyltransferase involved in cell wall bisynthesis [Jannaschia faecimaris]|uniref:Glycosyltransferase involved in cell wall bisynthesis n=1 Tax=Jannaschia faecimaris TaxID=1244108 RepID=A0A1H3IYZ5_9RHOB|nr:glycosyltransferase family 4 protein [Jannaschia faecimaris]SDY32872.1 Glycosyltransferase involved in cell wall bisynthesis [Jannaschia faecimaris]
MSSFNPPRRVLIVVENLPVPLDRRVWLEATSLTAAGYEVSVICPTGRGWDKPREVINGVHIYRHPAPPEAHAGAMAYAREYLHAIRHWFRLARVVRRDRGFDVIQGCNPPDLIWLLALRYRLAGVRSLFDHHDVCPELFEAKFGKRGLLYGVMRLWERITFACAQTSIATNESFARIARERGGMAAEDVFVVRSAPQIEKFLPGPGDATYRRAGTVLGWIGIIGQQEGLDLMVEAVSHLIAMGKTDVHVVVIGFGPHQQVIEDKVRQAGLSERFTFTGALYGDVMLGALNAIDIGLAPDPKNAMNDISTMNKVMEYMTLEKPCVQFDLTEGRASAGDASLYARANDPEDFADKIAWLMDNPQEARAMGQRGRDRVLDTLSWDHSVPQLLAAYERVFSK